MSLTPKTPIPEGAIRYNTDSNKMEVWIGDKWMIVATSSPNLDGGSRGLIMGAPDGKQVAIGLPNRNRVSKKTINKKIRK